MGITLINPSGGAGATVGRPVNHAMSESALFMQRSAGIHGACRRFLALAGVSRPNAE
jgi:hypothetical protein